jgi:hypothetical protein
MAVNVSQGRIDGKKLLDPAPFSLFSMESSARRAL